jgi:hypothetical protein
LLEADTMKPQEETPTPKLSAPPLDLEHPESLATATFAMG